jgi:hypothetical protein
MVSIGNNVNGIGNNGVYIGSDVSSIGTGLYNILIGYNSTASASANAQSGIAIGYQPSFNGNNDICIGNTSICGSTSATANNIAIGTNSEIITGTTGVNSIALGNAAKVNSNISNSVAIGAGAIASVNNTIVLGRATETVYIPNRLQFTASSYSTFTSQQLGYYLKTTGTSTAVTTATPKSIVTISSANIPVGVWRIDFSVQNTVSVAGTITSAQTFISTTLDGGNGTAVAFTGSLIRSHVSEVYGIGDIQTLTGSITYRQTTAINIYLNIQRNFTTGTYAFVGEVGITRIA